MYDSVTTKNILEKLGISPDAHRTSILFSKIRDALINDPHPVKVINAELSALPALRDAAIAQAKQNYKLAVHPITREPIINYSWDSHNLTWNIELKVAADAPEFADRKIKISIHSRAGNNNYGPIQVYEAFNARLRAAQTFYPGNAAYQKTIITIQSEFKSQVDALSAELSYKDVMVKSVIKNFNSLQKAYVARLSQEIYRATIHDPNYNPNEREILAARDVLKRAEIEMLSTEQRPILMNVYFQDGPRTDRLQTLLNIVEPLSDVSSDLRDEFIDDNPANFFKVTNKIIFVNPNANTITMGASESFYRGASLTLLRKEEVEADLDEDLEEDLEAEFEETEPTTPTMHSRTVSHSAEDAAEYLLAEQTKVMHKFIKNLYKEKLIQLLDPHNLQQTLDPAKPFLVSLSIDSLLSPMLTKDRGKMLSSIVSATANTFVIGNELEQLRAIRACCEELDDIPIMLTEAEKDSIVADIKRKIPGVSQTTLNSIRTLELRPRLAYFNTPANKLVTIRGVHVPTGLLDRTSYNTQHNEAGLKLYRRNIREFIQSHKKHSAATTPRIEFEGLFNDSIDHKQWKKLRSLVVKGKYEINENVLTGFDLATKAQLRTIIMSYVRLQDYVYGNTSAYDYMLDPRKLFSKSDIDTDNNRIAQGYMLVTASLFVMNQAMGITNYSHCKSGKDRTGLFCLIREALLDADSNDKLIENICNALQHSSAQTMNAMNVPGAKALQVDNDILDGLKELFGVQFKGVDRIKKILEQQQGRKVGSQGKHAYKIGGAARKLAKSATSPEARPIKIVAPNILNVTEAMQHTPKTVTHKAPAAAATSHAIQTSAPSSTTLKPAPTTPKFTPPAVNAVKTLRHTETKLPATRTAQQVPDAFQNLHERRQALAKAGLKIDPKKGKPTPKP